MRRLPYLCLSLLTLLLAGRAEGQSLYRAILDSSQVLNNESDSTATGMAFFSLTQSSTGPQLAYSVSFNGLDLEPLPENRTDPNDVIGIHMHLHVGGVIGPHIFNVFGVPEEADDELVVDYENDSLTGVFDLSDASRDPDTGEILEQFFPLTTKIIDDWLDELAAGELYIAVHTRDRTDNSPPGVAIRGNIYPVPEPATDSLIGLVLIGLLGSRSLGRRTRRSMA